MILKSILLSLFIFAFLGVGTLIFFVTFVNH